MGSQGVLATPAGAAVLYQDCIDIQGYYMTIALFSLDFPWNDSTSVGVPADTFGSLKDSRKYILQTVRRPSLGALSARTT